jgi:hypothetical protein
MLTGVPPRDSGVRTNAALTRTPLDNVARRLRADGRRAVEIGDQVDWWSVLFGDDLAATRLTTPDALAGEAIPLMPGADLLLVHLCDVDRAGHATGASSLAYLAAARAADDRAGRLAAAWGWPAANVVVLADHGHMPRGGHGGGEPDVRRSFFAAGGPAIAAGARRDDMRMIDVAPTLAAMLGTAAPATAEGRAWLEALALPAPARATLAVEDEARAGRAQASAAAARAALTSSERRAQLLRLAASAAVLVLGVLAVRRARRAARLGLACGVAAFALTAAVFAVRYGVPSFSADRTSSKLGYATGLIAAVSCALAFAPAFVAVVRRRLSAAAAAATAVAASAGAAPAALAAFIVAGAFAPRLACEPAWLAALPLVAYAAYVPALIAAAVLVGMAVAIEGVAAIGRGKPTSGSAASLR